MTRMILSLCVLIAIASSAVAAESDWPGWLGPNRDGKSLDTGLLKQWPAEGPRLLWKVDRIGVGFSSVVVTGGKVYITGDRDGKLTIFAFDLDGQPLWKTEHGQGRDGPDGSRSSPVIDNGNLYLLGGHGLIGCYDAESGEKNLAGLCAKISQSVACKCCSQRDCEMYMARLLTARRNTLIFDIPYEHCERWVFEFERQLGKTERGGRLCVKESNVTTFTLKVPRGLYGEATAHAAYRVIFCDGTVVYFDNGAFGGIFYQEDIPANASEDYPPQ